MNVRIEPGPIDALRYSGEHACTEEDDQQDDRASEYLARRIREGQNKYLLDVRGLYVVFGSSLGGLLYSWRPAIQGDARVALLWKPNDWKLIDPGDLRRDRWKSFVDQINAAASQTGRREFMPFLDEEKAITYLLSEEPGPA